MFFRKFRWIKTNPFQMINFWNETLQNISKDQRKDKFVFLVNDKRFEVPLSYAIAISPFIGEEFLKDPTFQMNIQDQEKIEEEFSNFIQGKEIRTEIFLKIGKFLKNQEMITKWKKTIELKERVNEYAKYLHDTKIYYGKTEEKEIIDIEDIKDDLQYIGKHLEEMKEDVKKFKEEILLLLIRNEDITIKSEDTIWEIIKERLKKMKREIYNDGNKKTIDKIQQMRRLLLETIKIKYLKQENFKEFIEEIEPEDIIIGNIPKRLNAHDYTDRRENIWNQIQEILLNNLKVTNIKNEEKEKDKNFKLIEHKEGKNFDGIIKYLEDKYGEDIHEKGIITITASSSCRNNPEQVINYKWLDYWRTNVNSKEHWWEINFKKMKVEMNGYSIKTCNSGSSCHLKSWIIEGRNEGGKWKEIDHQDNNDLNGFSYQHYYSIQEKIEPYQYIRIQRNGLNHGNDKELLLNNFEIYGKIKEDNIDHKSNA